MSEFNEPILPNSTISTDSIEPLDTDPAKESVAREEGSNEGNASPVQRIDPNQLKRSHFYFGKTLGEGSYARVVHAKMKVDNSPQFAIKIMEKAHIQKEKKVKFVMMEKKILSMMSHPFIIKLYYTFQDAYYLFMCMDIAAGGELLSLINRCLRENELRGLREVACSREIARFYVAEIIEALEYLHENNVIHMDLKPENVLITGDGHIKVADFGTAQLSGPNDENMKNVFAGTAEYVSPEVLSEDETVTRACDLWAVGCILYQALCGRTPFRADTEYLIFQAITGFLDGSQELRFPDSINEVAKDLILKLLVQDPVQRLGGGPPGSATDYAALKAHPFFEGVRWGELATSHAPFIPNPADLPSTENMTDGALDDWLLDDEVNPLNDVDRDSDLQPSGPSEEAIDASLAQKTKWLPFLARGENQVFTGLVSKRVGLFAKRRQLILTDAPRLLYVDPETMEKKGEIPWTADNRIRCIIISASAFDIWCPATRRMYHFTDSEGAGSQMWSALIDAMLDKQAEANGKQ